MMNMETILCKHCSIEKLKSDFHKNMRVCIDCYNKKRRKNYTEITTTPLTMLENSTKDFLNMVSISNKKNIYNVKTKLLWNYIGAIINTIELNGLPLTFKLKISDAVNDYFRISMDRGNSHSLMYRVLKNVSYANEFQKIFGITQQDLDSEENIEEMKLIIEALDAIKFAYNVFIEDENVTNNCSIITNPLPKIFDISTKYNSFTKSIDVDKNPLHFTIKSFLEKVAEYRDDIRIQCSSAETIWEQLPEFIQDTA